MWQLLEHSPLPLRAAASCRGVPTISLDMLSVSPSIDVKVFPRFQSDPRRVGCEKVSSGQPYSVPCTRFGFVWYWLIIDSISAWAGLSATMLRAPNSAHNRHYPMERMNSPREPSHQGHGRHDWPRGAGPAMFVAGLGQNCTLPVLETLRLSSRCPREC